MLFAVDSSWQYASELGHGQGIIEYNDDGLTGWGYEGGSTLYIDNRQSKSEPVLIDLLIVWHFVLMYQTRLRGKSLVIYCHRHQLYVGLQKLKCANPIGVCLLKFILTMCIEFDIAVIPFFDPLD